MATIGPPVFPNSWEKQAQEVAQRLTVELGRLQTRQISRSTETRYPLLADVEFAIEELRYFLVWANNTENKVACIRDDEGIVPIVGLSAAGVKKYRPEYPPSFRDPFVYANFSGLTPQIVWSQPAEVPEMVLPILTKYLAVRFQWIADNPGFRSLGAASSAQANNPYLKFTVSTQRHGLRIHYSKTFAISFNNVFGAPTTPLNGWILPGIHKFAGMDGSGNFYYDTGTFTTPPDFSAQLML